MMLCHVALDSAKWVSEFFKWRCAHCYHGSASQGCRGTTTVTDGTGTFSICAETFYVVFISRRDEGSLFHVGGLNTAKAHWLREVKFVGPSDSRTKQSAAIDDLSKPPEHRGPPSSSGLHCLGTSTHSTSVLRTVSQWRINMWTSCTELLHFDLITCVSYM